MSCLFKFLSFSFLCLFITYGANAQQSSSAKPIALVYDIYNKGFHIITISVTYVLNKDNYMVKAHFSSPSLASLFFSINMYSSVSGNFKDNHALPNVFTAIGETKKQKSHIVIDFNDNNKTVVKVLVPAIASNRDPLTDTQIQNSLDIISAMVELVYKVHYTGKCDSQFNILDGTRIFAFKSQTVGEAEIPSSWASPYRGKASLCSAVAQQTGGLKHSRNRALMGQPQPGSLWFKDVDGVGFLPVRFEFRHPKMGMVTAILRTVPEDTH